MTDLAAKVLPGLRALLTGDGAAPITDLAAARVARRAIGGLRGGPAGHVGRVVDIAEGGVRLRLYEPLERCVAGPLIVIHGGGWVWGGIDDVDPLARTLANATGRLTASVGYRLAPEHCFPAALDDVSAAVDWLLVQPLNLDRSDIVLLGMSAGGNLAAALSARRRGTVAPIAAQVLIHPMLDPSLKSDSARQYASIAPLSVARAAWFWDQYAPGMARAEPAAAPSREPEPGGLPRTDIVLAEFDILRDEGLAYADRLRAAAVPVTTRVWPGTVHGFITMAGLVPEVCAAAVADITEWIARGSEAE